MSAEEDQERLVEAWEYRLTRRGTLAAASEAIGFDESYISRVKGEKRGPRSLDLLRSLYAVNDPWPGDVFHDAYSAMGVDHARLLECAREFQPLAQDRFLQSVAPRLRALAAAGPTSGSKHRWQSRRAKIAALDELRKQDRKLAKTRLQDLILWGLGRLEETGERSRAAFGDLSCALGVLAAIHRLAGRRDAAMDCLLLGRPLALASEDPHAKGHWYKKTVFLFVDLKRYDRAYLFAHEALKFFFLARSPDDQAAVIADIGYVQSHAALRHDAKETLEQALKLLPEQDRPNRFAAHQILAKQEIALGNLESAARHLDLAIALLDNDVLALASLYWHRAKLAVALGEVAVAVRAFEAALPLYLKQAGAGEVMEVTLDFAALLLREGRRPELRRLATDVNGWVHRLGGSRKLKEAIADFKALVELDELTSLKLKKLIQKVTGIANRPRKTRRRSFNSPG